MKIMSLQNSDNTDGVLVRAHLHGQEFRQLNGYLENLVLFHTLSVDEPTRTIKTGARHSFARYLLLPVKLRKAFKAETHDLEDIRCGAVENGDRLFVVYSIRKKEFGSGENEGPKDRIENSKADYK